MIITSAAITIRNRLRLTAESRPAHRLTAITLFYMALTQPDVVPVCRLWKADIPIPAAA
jgi:hypothetical protein